MKSIRIEIDAPAASHMHEIAAFIRSLGCAVRVGNDGTIKGVRRDNIVPISRPAIERHSQKGAA